MRAIGYYAKYHVPLMAGGEAGEDAYKALVREFLDETGALLTLRHIKTDRGAISIIEEVNEKWNAVVSIFEKRGETPPIVRDGFRHLIETEIPELRRGEAT